MFQIFTPDSWWAKGLGSGLHRFVQGVKFIKIAKKLTGSRPQKKYKKLNSVETYHGKKPPSETYQ